MLSGKLIVRHKPEPGRIPGRSVGIGRKSTVSGSQSSRTRPHRNIQKRSTFRSGRGSAGRHKSYQESDACNPTEDCRFVPDNGNSPRSFHTLNMPDICYTKMSPKLTPGYASYLTPILRLVKR